MNVGDLVQYRSWRVGDPLPEDTPESRKGWNRIGVVVDIGDWKLGSNTLPNESALMYTEQNELIEVWTGDIDIINKAEISSTWEIDCDRSIINNNGNYLLK